MSVWVTLPFIGKPLKSYLVRLHHTYQNMPCHSERKILIYLRNKTLFQEFGFLQATVRRTIHTNVSFPVRIIQKITAKAGSGYSGRSQKLQDLQAFHALASVSVDDTVAPPYHKLSGTTVPSKIVVECKIRKLDWSWSKLFMQWLHNPTGIQRQKQYKIQYNVKKKKKLSTKYCVINTLCYIHTKRCTK